MFGAHRNLFEEESSDSPSESIFGGTSTGLFGAQASWPAFGVSSTPAFGASSSPAFGSSSSPFGGSCVFGHQKPAFGGFGSTTTSSPFGSSVEQSQPAFGSTTFPSQPGFGGSSTPALSTPAFGVEVGPPCPRGIKCVGPHQPEPTAQPPPVEPVTLEMIWRELQGIGTRVTAMEHRMETITGDIAAIRQHSASPGAWQ